MRTTIPAVLLIAASMTLTSLSGALAGDAPTPAAGAPAAIGTASANAEQIIANAHQAAGGALWRAPKSLHLIGTAVLYPDGALSKRQQADHYEMWRVFPSWNQSAHAPSGKVRIDAKSGEHTLFQIAFDGKNTYNAQGLVPGSVASKEWAEAFGFGIIRFALDAGFKRQRLPDDLVDLQRCFVVRVTDVQNADTVFWIDQSSFEIRKVGFDTPKGWHERTYSDFFRLENGWMQPGRVRLTYRGALSNDVRWHTAVINSAIPDALFVLKAP